MKGGNKRMKQKEIIELMKENFEEISEEEFNNMNDKGKICVYCVDGNIFFKPKGKFPKIFEDENRKVTVWKDGGIDIFSKITNESIFFYDSLPILYDAVKCSKKQREKI